MMQAVELEAQKHGLMIMGAFHPNADDPSGSKTLVLLGPAPDFWDHFSKSTQAFDDRPDPIDRWSTEHISAIAAACKGQAFFPFGGPPYMPFLSWAMASGRAWQSPVGMLVHDTHGLMVSYRGAIGFDHALPIEPSSAPSPCISCKDTPCLTACPVNALGHGDYDHAACKSYLAQKAGQDCLQRGCLVRRICPVSVGAHRQEPQSALHMRAFKGD